MIQIIYTGGTIGMVPSQQGLIPNLELFQQQVSEFIGEPVHWCNITPLIDSSQITPDHWRQIIATIDPGCDATIILHGTDTLAYSAAILAIFKPAQNIILTGSQLSWFEPNSDAPANINLALANIDKPGCHIAFGGQLINGLTSYKRHTEEFDGFASYSSPASNLLMVEQPLQNVDYRWLTPTPGQSIKPEPCQVLILENLGSGQMPLTRELLASIEQAQVTLVTSQCPNGTVKINRYAASAELVAQGAIGCGVARREEIIAACFAAFSQTNVTAKQWLTDYFANR